MTIKTCLFLLLLATPVCAQERNAPACDTAQAKAFDFLLGEWRAAEGPGQMRIEKILRGCALRETWHDQRGESLLLRSFDEARQKWFLLFLMDDRLVHQSWEGRWEAGQWRFYREWVLDGQAVLSRTYWNPLANGGFEKVVEQSRDQGKTWRLHAKGVFYASLEEVSKRCGTARVC
jgi:hypothetical protein